MEDPRIKKWNEAKRARKSLEDWNNLPLGPRYQNDKFAISVAHCKPPVLTRAGQQSAGCKNYWETNQEIGIAIVKYLTDNWASVYPEVLGIMEEKERKALSSCQEFITEMTELINEADI